MSARRASTNLGSLSCVAELALKERTLKGLAELKLPYHQRQIQTKTVIISSKEAKDLLEQIFLRHGALGHALIPCGSFVFEVLSGSQRLLYYFSYKKTPRLLFNKYDLHQSQFFP